MVLWLDLIVWTAICALAAPARYLVSRDRSLLDLEKPLSRTILEDGIRLIRTPEAFSGAVAGQDGVRQLVASLLRQMTD